MFANNLLYLLLLYAVLDDDNKLSPTTGILIAAGIMLFSAYCCPQQPRCTGGNAANPFAAVNSLLF